MSTLSSPPKHKSLPREHSLRIGIISVAVTLICLEAITIFLSGPETFIYPLHDVIASIPSAFKRGRHDPLLHVHALLTLRRTLLGFAFASVLGIGLGTLMAMSRRANSALLPIVDFLRPLPSAALTLLAALVLGSSEIAHLFIIVFGAIWPVLFGTRSGIQEIGERRHLVLRTLHLKPLQRVSKFYLPGAAPAIYNGMKISLSICLILAVTAEMLIGTKDGIGEYMRIEREGHYEHMYVAVIIVALMGFLLNKLFVMSERLHPWLKYRIG